MKYTDLPKDENPRNRIRDLGPMSLSASEVLAVALWVTETETSQELAKLYKSLAASMLSPATAFWKSRDWARDTPMRSRPSERSSGVKPCRTFQIR